MTEEEMKQAYIAFMSAAIQGICSSVQNSNCLTINGIVNNAANIANGAVMEMIEDFKE